MIDQNQAFNTILWLSAMLAQTSNDLTASQQLATAAKEVVATKDVVIEKLRGTINELETMNADLQKKVDDMNPPDQQPETIPEASEVDPA